MNKLCLICTTLLIAAMLSSCKLHPISSDANITLQPNILFIYTDDQAPWALGRSGNLQAITPNLDNLAKQGMYLPNAYTTTPVCSPSRAGLLTSRYGYELGIDDWINPNAKSLTGKQPKLGLDPAYETWPEVLQRNGYTTGLIGKWHLGTEEKYHPTNHGYNQFIGFKAGGNTPINPTLEINGKEVAHEGLTVDLLTDYAIDFLHAQQIKPFVLSLHYRAPHYRFLPVAPEDAAPFANIEIALPHPNYPDLNTERARILMREYLSSVKGIDRNVGRLLEALAALQLDQNTVVIFTSDHGYNIAHNGIWHKGNGYWLLNNNPAASETIPSGQRPNLYDNSLKVPTIVRWPQVIKPNTENPTTVSNLDWYPTILAMTNSSVAKDQIIRGKNILPIFSDDSRVLSKDYYAAYTTQHQSITYMRMYSDGRFKLVKDFRNKGRNEFYDLINDPEETRNLLSEPMTPTQKRTLQKLDTKILEKMRETNDPILKRFNF